MIIKKNKAVIAALISAAMTVTALVPTVSAARSKAEKFGDKTYAERFCSLYDDVVTNGQENGYLSKNNVASGGFGVPYHCVETLNIEAPDYGHETTSEAMSYIVWMAAMRDNIGNKGVVSGATNEGDLAKAWKTMEIMIPETQSGFMNKSELSAQYSEEHDDPKEYPSPQYSDNTGKNPIHAKFSQTYGSDSGLYLMHWLADVDDWYGYNGGSGKFTFINTFQRGAQESCWETIPHACVEELKYGMPNRGIKGVFEVNSGQPFPKSWSYTNAPDAEDRAIQAVYAAERWGVAPSDVVSKAGKMGDQLRNNMFDKYYKKIGCQNPQSPSANGYDGAHYLMSWYTSWGGALDGSWAWQIGASHCHEFYQNPLAAYALIADDGLRSGMKVGEQAVQDYEKSLTRQLEFYLWLQSEQGPIAGGATSSWHGRYLKYEYLDGVDDEYITKYGTKTPTTFYEMAYQEHPVYADPGSNHWIGNQVWAIQRLAELYYDIKTNPTDVSAKIQVGDKTMEEALKLILDRWVEWFLGEVKLTADGDYEIPASLDWFGQPADWTGTYKAKTGVTCEVVATGNSDLGCVSSLCNTLIYYAKANNVASSAAYDKSGSSVAAKGLYTARELLDREWKLGRDDIGLTRTEHNGSMKRLFEQEVWVPSDYNGTMPNGDKLANGATFLGIRSMYNSDPMVQKFKAAYDAAGGASASESAKEEAMESIDLQYHRFWHAGDIMLALGTMAELYPDVTPDGTSPDPQDDIKDGSFTINKGESKKIDESVIGVDPSGATFTPDNSGVITVSPDGTVTAVKGGTGTVVVSKDGKTATVTVTVKDSGVINPDDDYMYGDVDLNDAVELADVTRLGKHLLNKNLYPLGNTVDKPGLTVAQSIAKATEQADVKYDQSVDEMDLSKLIEFNLNTISMDELGPGR